MIHNERKVRTVIAFAGLITVLSPFLLLALIPGSGAIMACSLGIVIAILIAAMAITGSGQGKGGSL